MEWFVDPRVGFPPSFVAVSILSHLHLSTKKTQETDDQNIGIQLHQRALRYSIIGIYAYEVLGSA
jgi:hypothetical protein